MTESSLLRTTDNVLKEKVQLLVDSAMLHITELEPYGINQPYVESLGILLKQYAESASKPRNNRKDNKQVTALLNTAFLDNAAILGEIDMMVETLRYSNPEFFQLYHERRKMMKTGNHSISVKANVISSESHEPLKGAHVKLVNAEDSKGTVMEKKTSEKGGIYVKNLNEGRYTMMVSLAGFEPKEVELFVTDAETTRLNISLNKRLSA